MCIYVCINYNYYLVKQKIIDSSFCAYVTRTLVMLVRNFLYQEKDERGDNNGVETTQVGISDEGTKYREECWDANPSVDILSCSGQWLVEFICEVRDEVTSEAIVGKALSHFNNFTHTPKKKKKKKKKKKEKENQILKDGRYLFNKCIHTFCTEIVIEVNDFSSKWRGERRRRRRRKRKAYRWQKWQHSIHLWRIFAWWRPALSPSDHY